MSKDAFKVKNSLEISPTDLSTISNPGANRIASDINDGNQLKKYNPVTDQWEYFNQVNVPLIQTIQGNLVTGGFGTITNQDWKMTVTGNMLKVVAGFTTGTATNDAATITLPNGFTHDSSIRKIVGRWWYDRNVLNSRKQGTLHIAGNGNVLFFGNDDFSVAQTPIETIAGQSVSGSSQVMWVEFELPITQLSQNTIQGLASQSINSGIALRRGTSAQTITTSPTVVQFNNLLSLEGSGLTWDAVNYRIYATRKIKLQASGFLATTTSVSSGSLVISWRTNGGSGTSYTNIISNSSSGQLSTPVPPVEMVLEAGEYLDLVLNISSGTVDVGPLSAYRVTLSEIPFSNTAIMAVPDAKLRVDGFSGLGSTGTAIGRFATVRVSSLGSFGTYTSSSTLGDSVTINIKGRYRVVVSNSSDGAGYVLNGISVNASSLTSQIQFLDYTSGYRASNSMSCSGGGFPVQTTWEGTLNVGDIVRPQYDTGSTLNIGAPASNYFEIEFLGWVS